jgi:hypothetical protein
MHGVILGISYISHEQILTLGLNLIYVYIFRKMGHSGDAQLTVEKCIGKNSVT